jgi:hypothetical protein
VIEKSIKYKDKKEVKKPVVQGGVENYLGRQPEVQAPRKWQSAPDKPSTELAYITEAEKKLIMKANLHGGLERGPNMGPSGIMSLDSFGDIGGAGASGGDTSASGGAMEGRGFSGRSPSEMGTDRQSQKAFEDRIENQKAQLQIAERKQAEALGYDERENIADMYSVDPLQRLYMQGVSDSNIPGLIGMGLNLTQPLRNFGLRKNIDYFRGLENIETKGYSKNLEGYESYMQDRLSGKIDAAGNLITSTGDGDSNYIQNVLSAQQQAAIANPLSNTTEVPQGGVGELYARYMRNLGYTL